MEPEGVVDVLRKLLRVLVPGGVVVDLLAVPPNPQVEVQGGVVGDLDASAFFPRAAAAAAGLDALAEESVLALEGGAERFTILVRYPSGSEAVEDVKDRTYTRIPAALGRRVEAIAGPVEIRETSLVRCFTKRA